MTKLLDLLKALFMSEKKFTETYASLAKANKPLSRPDKSDKSLSAADIKLQKAFRLIREKYQKKFPGRTFVITEVFRHPKKQKELYAKGRTKPGKIVTYVDGYDKKGKHNYWPSKAIDIAIRERDGSITWDTRKYKPLIKIAEDVSKQVGYKVINGGSWTRLKDYPHFEI